MDKNGYNPNRLSNEIGVHASTIANYLTEKTKPSSLILEKIASYFRVSNEWLTSGKGDIEDHFKPNTTSNMETPERMKRYIELLEKEVDELRKQLNEDQVKKGTG